MQKRKHSRLRRTGRSSLIALLGLSLAFPVWARPDAVSAASARTIEIDAGQVISQDFLGVGVNLMPQSLMAKTLSYGYSDAHWEVDRKRILTAQPKVARVWFQIDWMEPQKGQYDWESEEMQAVYAYLDAFKEAGTEVELNFGWKVGSQAQAWFGIPGQEPTTSAPADLDAYGRSASALLSELLDERGYDNVKYLTFYNEPNGSWDFEAPGDQKAYYAQMATKVSQQLEQDGLRDRIQIWGPEEVDAPAWTAYMEQNAGEHFDAYSFHVYGAGYDTLDDAIKLRTDVAGGKPVHLTEFGWRYDDISGWDAGFANNVIQAADSGASSALVWQMTGTWTTDPLGDVNGAYTMWDSNVFGLKPNRTFYAASLLSRYVPEHSTVIAAKTDADDVRAAAFKTADGDYAVLVESKGGEAKELTFDFGDTSVNKTFYKHEYTDGVPLEGNAIVPGVSGTFQAGSSFVDPATDSDYSFAVYTTEAPQAQVAVTPVDPYVAGGESVTLGANVIDGSGGVTWSVLGQNAGTINASGVYTAPSIDTEKWVAVRAQSTNDPDAYGIALVKVTPKKESGRAEAPSFSLKHGLYPSAEAVRLQSATPNAQIRYTTDGSEPTASSSLYNGPILLPEATTLTLKAKAFASGLQDSAVSSSFYRTRSMASGPDGYAFAGYEGDTIAFSGTKSVAYGADGRFVYKTLTGGATISDATFGGDPAPGFEKRGYVSSAVPASYPVVTVINAGFERPGTTGASGGPMNNGWSFKTESGVQANTSPFQPSPAPEGKQSGYLKTTNGVAGEFSQSVYFPAGRYELTFQAAKRAGYGDQTFDVWFDNAKIGSYNIASSTYAAYNTDAFEAAEGKHLIRFVATKKTGDNAAFIDTVAIAPTDRELPGTPVGGAELSNSGFETPVVTGARFGFTADGWAFDNHSGIQRNGKPFYAPDAPDGSQTAYLKTDSSGSGVFGQKTNFAAGTYRISFQASQRPGYAGIQKFDLYVGTAKVGSFQPASAAFEPLQTEPFAVAAGEHEVRFVATSTSGDNTAFIDGVEIEAVAGE
ncbi:chitobiase/beta-hexosaminidase C-terminal domain-containing protein [Saccharibacillus sp. O23]|uniref:chitobiase/beta-hexosaminidase C-terminal domain-containing protein n=1 Tax=Saccharibacillus sp. O23 TaxID=2009338 RepID=UPI0015C68BBD|nr:chitobiase/beta-hexosaminidase C-terminal domain-containing protein [Saccharibacillus sp. O23]